MNSKTKTREKQKIVDEDTSLIEKIQAGEVELFEELVSKYEIRIYNFGVRMCKDQSDAEDLVQETFINIFKYLGGFRMETRFKNWVYKIAASVCLKIKKKNGTADKYMPFEEIFPVTEKEISDQAPEWTYLPVEVLMNKELADKIKSELDKLLPKYRIVLVLRDIEGFSTKEVVEILNISESNVKVRLLRARAFLRDGLRRYFDEEK